MPSGAPAERRRSLACATVFLLGVTPIVAFAPGHLRRSPRPLRHGAHRHGRRATPPLSMAATPPAEDSLARRLVESVPSAEADALIGEDAATFSLEAQSSEAWYIFAAAVSTVLAALYVLWIRADTGYSDDFIVGLEELCGSNSHLVNLCIGIIFPLVHSGLASIRPAAEKIVGARTWRVVFACASLPLAWTWILYFVGHRYDGIELWDLHGSTAVHVACWLTSFASFFFLYPSTFNLLEVAAVEKPQLHLWESGVIRITRHPQMVGQVMWSAAHVAWVGTTFCAETMALLIGHHLFSVWNGDRRLRDQHGEVFDQVEARTSVVPFAAIIDGRQKLPSDYWTEWMRLPYAVIAGGTIGAYFFHPVFQAAAALVENTGFANVPNGYSPGGILDVLFQ
mmetsp:Transcript_35271/g.94460  ORF Transcript_35271/g.94460 Transcript_35271/m.94460 type:complete len:396 (-) Transcript_35271:289-1476(-)